MLRFSRVRTVALATAVVLIGGVATSASVGLSAGATASVAGPTGINHYLCYVATPVHPYSIPGNLILKNQFNPNGFEPTVSQDQLVHCNPVKKTVGTTTYPIVYPHAHLLCYPITAPPQQTFHVSVRNQFGKATLLTGQPSALCLPTWKNLNHPPTQTQVEPGGVDHFTCYPVTYASSLHFHPPGPVSLQDQFSPTSVSVTVGDPSVLCVPTTKIANGVSYPAVRPQKHLLCFNVSQTPKVPTLWDKNQFGTEQLNIQTTAVLCLPSFKSIVP
jgi:hypothetical protein